MESLMEPLMDPLMNPLMSQNRNLHRPLMIPLMDSLSDLFTDPMMDSLIDPLTESLTDTFTDPVIESKMDPLMNLLLDPLTNLYMDPLNDLLKPCQTISQFQLQSKLNTCFRKRWRSTFLNSIPSFLTISVLTRISRFPKEIVNDKIRRYLMHQPCLSLVVPVTLKSCVLFSSRH